MDIIVRTIDGHLNPSYNHSLAIILPVVLVTVTVLTLTLIGFCITKRRRKIRVHFNEAQLRDPSLTWEDYERRGNLTRSRLLVEEDLLRSAMIRKTQQSRASACKEVAAVDAARPTRTRSKTWNGRTKSQDEDREDGRTLLQGIGADGGSAQANVERTWDILHRKKYPTLGSNILPRVENDQGPAQQPPTVRLRTPPLLSHPVFRGEPRQLPPRHLSLPTELIRVQSEPVTASSSTLNQLRE